MNVKSAALSMVGLGLVMSMAACSSASDAAEETAADNAAYCQSSAAAQAELSSLRTLILEDATVDQVIDQRNTAVDAISDAQQDAVELSDSVRLEIQIADEAFDEAVGEIPGDSSVSDAADSYNAAIDDWDTSLLSIRDGLGCSQ